MRRENCKTEEKEESKEKRKREGKYIMYFDMLIFSTFSQTCGNSITLDQPRLQHDNQVWHGTDQCFLCYYCKESLIGQPFLPKHGRVFCSKDHAKKFKAKSKT